MKERLISYQFHVLDWFIYVRFDHTFPCCIVVKDVKVFNQCRKFLPRISSSHTSRNRLALNKSAHKNIIMTTDERWKVNLFIAHPCWFIYCLVSSHETVLQRSATSCKVLRSSEPSVSNLCNLELAHGIYYQYYSVDCIFVIVLLSMQSVWFVDTVYCWSQLHQK